MTEGELVSKRILFLLCAALASVMLLGAACGGDDDDDGGTSTTEEAGTTEGAKVIDPASMDGASGTINYCTGQDTTGERKDSIARFEQANPNITVKLVEFPASADEQRNQFIQRQEAKSSECDLFGADVIWTAEFAQQKWLYDMSPYIETRKDQFIPSTLETLNYDGKYWGVPKDTNAGFLYYRTDEVQQEPDSWQAVYEDAKAKNGIVYQGAAYEGLTVDFLELAYSAGGTVLNEDGTEPTINSEQNLNALEFMVNGIKDGAAPRAVVTMMEPESERAFTSGRSTYMRNWPYVYAIGQQDRSKVKDKFEVVPYPPFEGGTTAGILGGLNLVISTYSKNPGAALAFIDFATNEESMNNAAEKFALPPALASSYENPQVQKALPFASELRQAVEQAKPRPVTPVYTQVSQAIYENVNAALAGEMSPQEALEKAQSDMEQALATF
jgi:multiple sugar transport system substrate-binding protein